MANKMSLCIIKYTYTRYVGGGYRKMYSGTIRVCEGRVWGVSTTNVRAWNYT